MPQLLLNIDVDDLERALQFYTAAFDLQIGRRLGDDFAELIGAQAPIYLLAQAAATKPFAAARTERSYRRHWTPVHMDFVVTDIAAAIDKAVAAGATLEAPAKQEPYGLLALLADPFGHGFCFLQFQGRGYDVIAT